VCDGAWPVRFGPLPREQMRAVLDHFAWDASPLAYDCEVAVKRDIAVEAQRDLSARRAVVAENRRRGVSENLREALRLVSVGERLGASVRRG
jgi:hypothetical protein